MHKFLKNKYFAFGIILISTFSLPFVFKFFYTTERNWSIGVYSGFSPINILMSALEYPVLKASDVTDVNARFVADPFLIKHNNRYFMYFEILIRESNKGVIGFAESADGVSWEYKKVVIEEEFHLSYPYIFKHQEAFYIIPESVEANAVYLYKTDKTSFPYGWVKAATLIEGYVEDPSIVLHNETFYLFGQTNRGKYDRLDLWYSEKLEGPWKKHPKSPIIASNPNIARPGGRIIQFENKMYRFAQDDYPSYGNQVWAFEILDLSKASYSEKMVTKPVITAVDAHKYNFLGGWNELGMHHVDAFEKEGGDWLIAVDGEGEDFILRSKSGVAH